MRAGVAGVMAMVVAACSSPCIGGCAATQRGSTRLTTEDVKEMAEQMAASMAASDFLRERGPGSARMVVALDHIENLSSDVVPVSEQWYLMERIRASTPLASLGAQRNIAFVIPAEQTNQLRDRGGAEAALFAAGRAPTHAMRGVLRSVTRSAGMNRTDLYSFEVRVIALESGDLAWSDSFELKRAAVGRQYD